MKPLIEIPHVDQKDSYHGTGKRIPCTVSKDYCLIELPVNGYGNVRHESTYLEHGDINTFPGYIYIVNGLGALSRVGCPYTPVMHGYRYGGRRYGYKPIIKGGLIRLDHYEHYKKLTTKKNRLNHLSKCLNIS